jgi:hypothetical protein
VHNTEPYDQDAEDNEVLLVTDSEQKNNYKGKHLDKAKVMSMRQEGTLRARM